MQDCFCMQASCKELFQDLLDKLSTSEYVWPPPKEMPQELYSNFTLNGRVQVTSDSNHISIFKTCSSPGCNKLGCA